MDMKRRDVLKGAAATTAAVAVGAPALLTPTPSYAQQVDAAKKWVDTEFQPSTLTKDQQMAEMEWFIKAAQPFKGMKVSCASEILSIHEYESKTLTKAFAEITGIQVNHEMMDEGLIVDKIEVEIQSGRPIYDFWMNDSDFIGTHPRYNDIVGGSLTDFMAGEGKDITNPNLDLKDFIGLSFATFTDGKLYQLPDQQFANLYWFRYDWFQRPELKERFKKQFGYELGVPVNWSAYEDIAEFFTNTVKRSTASASTATWTTARRIRRSAGASPTLGCRWPATATAVCPTVVRWTNGAFVQKTAFRVGSSVTRGGDANGPAAVYALTKFVEWLKKYAPPEAAGMDFLEAGAVPGQGHVAQQIFWYTAFTHALSKPDLPVMNPDGTPKWRMAPSPHGAYWKEGMKLGYQDQGCWTLLKYAPTEKHQGRMALRPVLRIEDRHAQEGRRDASCDPRKRHLRAMRLPRSHRKWAGGSSSTAARRASCGRRPASTCPNTASWRRYGGRTCRRRSPASRPHSKPWTVSRATRTPSWRVSRNRAFKASLGPS